MLTETDDTIPSSIQEFYDLFKKDLSNVTFPDISIEILENLISEVHEKFSALKEAQAQVIAAQEALEASQNELLQKSIRGLAYAKIYAEGQEELSEKLAQIVLSKGAKSSKGTTEGKRTRAKKSEEPKEQSVEEVIDQ